MKRPKREKRKMERAVDAWLGMLLFHAAKGDVDDVNLGQRLQVAIAGAIEPRGMQQTACDALDQIREAADNLEFKSKVLAKCTSQRMAQHLSLAEESLTWRPIARGSEHSHTVADLVQRWATWTGQDSGDFAGRVYPKLIPMVKDWRRKTGCPGLTDEEMFRHPAEAAKFQGSFLRVLLEETPQAKLMELAATAMRTITETSPADLEARLHSIIGDACAFMAWRTGRDVGAVIEAHPQVKPGLSTPEVAAVVEYEGYRQQLGGDADKAVELLERSLAPELEEHMENQGMKTALRNALESTARFNHMSNLKDGISGSLHKRLLEATLRWLKKWRLLPRENGAAIAEVLAAIYNEAKKSCSRR